MSYEDWEDCTFESLVEGNEYKIKWISSVYTANHQLDKDDMVMVVSKQHGGNLTVRKSTLSILDQFHREHAVSYGYITLARKKIVEPKELKCTCSTRDLFNIGCRCGSFKNGDK